MGLWEKLQEMIGMEQQSTQQSAAPTTTVEQPVKPTKPSYFDRVGIAESSGNASAKAKTSSAAGLYQYTEGTWKEAVDKYKLGYTLDDRFDAKKSRIVLEKHTEENRELLKKHFNEDPTDTDLYAAHFLGVAGAKKFLGAAPKRLAKDVVTPATYKANKSIFYDSKTKKHRTVAQVYDILRKKIGD